MYAGSATLNTQNATLNRFSSYLNYQMKSKTKFESLINFDTFIEDEYISISTVEGENNFNTNYLYVVFGIIIVFTLFIGYNKFRSNREDKKVLKKGDD